MSCYTVEVVECCNGEHCSTTLFTRQIYHFEIIVKRYDIFCAFHPVYDVRVLSIYPLTFDFLHIAVLRSKPTIYASNTYGRRYNGSDDEKTPVFVSVTLNVNILSWSSSSSDTILYFVCSSCWIFFIFLDAVKIL